MDNARRHSDPTRTNKISIEQYFTSRRNQTSTEGIAPRPVSMEMEISERDRQEAGSSSGATPGATNNTPSVENVATSRPTTTSWANIVSTEPRPEVLSYWDTRQTVQVRQSNNNNNNTSGPSFRNNTVYSRRVNTPNN